jgi:hypothetical protein
LRVVGIRKGFIVGATMMTTTISPFSVKKIYKKI